MSKSKSSMTYIFVENATPANFAVNDHDGHSYGPVYTNGYYSLKLIYSPTFEKQYTFTNLSNGSKFSMWIGIDGLIARIEPNNQVHLEVKCEEHNTRIQIFPSPLKTSDRIIPSMYFQGIPNNKLLITPINQIYNRVIPKIAPPVPDRALRLDFV